jgi:WD40 repeat protein
VWIPHNRLLACDRGGSVFEISVDLKSAKCLGSFSIPDKRGNKVLVRPTQAVLSVSNFIVGTAQGNLYWYPVLNLMHTGDDEPIVEFQTPVLTCNVRNAVSALAVDQNYLTLLVGTFAGDLFKVPVDVVESDFGKTDHDIDALNGSEVGKVFKPVESVAPVHLGNDAHNGGVFLCSNHLTAEVQKFSARSRSSLSMFLTGSHLGVVQFWRYSSQVVDNFAAGGGIRRSAPRALRSVFQLALADTANAVCTMELLPLPMKHAKLLVIGAEDGSIEVWTLEAQENEDEDARDSSSSEDKAGYSLRLLEDDEGSCLVRLEARRIFQAKLFTGPVSMVCAYTASGNAEQRGLKIAVGSEGDPRVYFLSVLKDDMLAVQKSVEAYIAVEPGYVVRSMAWTDDVLHLFCAGGETLLYQTKDCDVPQFKKRTVTGLPVVIEASLAVGIPSVMFLTNSRQVRICSVRSLQDERSAVEFRAYDHPDVVVIAAHAPNGRFFATGCADGSIFIWRVDMDTEEVQEANRLRPHSSAVSALMFSSDSSLLFCSAIDGSCFLLTLDKPTTKGPNRNGSVKASFVQEDGPQYLADILPEKTASGFEKDIPRPTMTWIEQRELEKAKDLKSRHKFKAMGIGAAINEIGQRLRVLIAQNAERNELEILDRSEFVIDVKRKDDTISENAAKAALTRRQYAQRNYCNELRAARIRGKCWDQQEIKATVVLPLLPSAENALGMGVSSFPVQKYSAEQLASLNKVKRLRGMEVRVQRADEQGDVTRIAGTTFYRSAWRTALAGCPQTVSWISNDGTRWPISDKVATLLAADKVADNSAGAGKEKGPDAPAAEADEDDGGMDEEELVLDENNVLNLLYPPQAVRSQAQKRTQILLLKEVIRQVRVKFNEQFEKLRREKADIIGSIESRNTRMRAILEDLHQHEDLFAPAVANKEVQGSTVVVDPSELQTTPYESEAARQVRLREEEEKRQRELAKDKEDAKGRALEEMMHGTLEVKRDVFAESSAFVKPEWMDTLAASEMNEHQLKEYDAYTAKVKTLQEEQAAYRKALEQEMKRLKNEVTELCKVFDEKLSELASLKVLVHREIFSHEIYISRLSFSMAKTEQTQKFLRKSEEQVQSLRADRAELRRSMELLSSQLEEMKSKIGAIQEDERQMDKTFRRDLQNLCNNTFDQDALKVLTQLYRQRTYPRGGEMSMENYGDQSEADASASASKNNRRSKDSSARGGKNSKSQSKRNGGGGLSTSSTNDVNKNKKMKASKGGASAGGGGKDGALGPMQQAAQALRSPEETSYKEKDPYYEALLELEKQKIMQEAQIPILSQQSIELDCPEGFDIDQFSWSKLQELRTARIEKEIEGKQLSIEFSKLKQKLERLDAEEVVLANCITDIKSSRDVAISVLRDLESNLDLIVRLRQGQDEVDRDAVVTDYSDALLLPIAVLSKYNSRIKELGKEKISILSKIKLFRRKINLIDWEAKHHGLEARHYEAYLTDLQLFRVTRELQKVIRDGSDTTQTKVSPCYPFFLRTQKYTHPSFFARRRDWTRLLLASSTKRRTRRSSCWL